MLAFVKPVTLLNGMPVLSGKAAMTRGHQIRLLGFFLGIIAIAVGIVLWRLGWLLS